MGAAVLNVSAVLVAALCVGGYLLAGEAAVLAVVLAAIGVLAWKVAATSRPRPLRGGSRAHRAPRPSVSSSVVRIRHQGDADVVHRKGGQRQRVEDLMETEPAG